MAETVSVNLSGPALAFLLYENVKSKHEQEGFLLGDTNEIITRTITDTDSHNEKRHKVININAVVPCPQTCLFYDNVGGINQEILESILGSKTSNVVGWYLYEPENNFQLTLRSKIIHKELCNMFSISPELFCCCLLASSKSTLESTFSYTHTFIRYCFKQFLTVPMHISNLGESVNSYKPKIHASKSFQKLCQSIKDTKKNTNDWQSIDVIQDKLHSEIIKTMRLLSHSEHSKAELEREVQQLRQQIEFQKNMLEDKALAEATAEAEKANEENEKNGDDEHAENNLNLMDLDINKLNELTSVNSEDSNLNNDLSSSNSSQSNIQETSILKGKDLNTSTNDKKTKKVISDVNTTQKTDKQENNTHVDTDNSPSTSSDVNSSCIKNLIDFTIPDEINSQNGSDGTAININNEYS